MRDRVGTAIECVSLIQPYPSLSYSSATSGQLLTVYDSPPES